MGLTLADRDQMQYAHLRKMGLSPQEILDRQPEFRKDEFLKNIQMSQCKAHFGMELKTLLIIMGIILVLGIILAIWLSSSTTM